MPRRKASESIANVLSEAESLRRALSTLPDAVRDKTKELALAIVAMTPKKRGRPPGKVGTLRKRGRPPQVQPATA
jgi:hypothetical protein